MWYLGVPIPLTVYDTLLCAVSLDADPSVETRGAGPKKDTSGIQLCERCDTRLCMAKGKKYACPPGQMCHGCYNKQHLQRKRKLQAELEEPVAAYSTPKRIRRTQSDPGYTHQQLVQLRGIVKESGTGVQGHQRTPEENARALLHVHQYQQHGLSWHESVQATAAAELTSPTTLRRANQQFQQTSSLPPPDTSRRGRGHPSHPLHMLNTDRYGPSYEAELLVHKLVNAQKTEGVTVTTTTIRADLLKELGISVSRSTVRRWLHYLDYRWRHKRYVGGMRPQAKNARIRQFILEYAAALSEEECGNAVVVYMDESFIYAHHSRKRGWFHSSSRDVIGDDDGKRLIILHAMTDSGLLTLPDTVGTNWLSEMALTAELVFEEVYEDGQDEGDYHNTMTGLKFVAWLRNRLLPTFAALYPGQKMFLVLDNASYHKARDETWISASKSLNKHELAHQLMDLGVMSIATVNAPHRIIDALKYEANVSDGGASKDDLLAAVEQWLAQHPSHNRTVVEQLMGDAGHTLVYTPPFCPEVQPIELLWAQVKRYVADHAVHNRSMDLARQQTEEAFERVTKMFCNRIVKHCHDWIDGFIKTEEAEDLQQCQNLAAVIKSLPFLKAASDAPSSAAKPAAVSIPAAAQAVPRQKAGRSLRPRRT